jgi:hypothetical protein
MRGIALHLAAAFCLCLLLLPADALARDWYVSSARGRGKAGSVEKPAKDLGNIISRLEDGDRVFIAEGMYLGRGENGCDRIDKPVEIHGGFSDDFTRRDPWGAHQTILAGTNTTENWEQGYRLSIDLSKRRDIRGPHRVVVDGIIVDNGLRNRYADETEAKIVRTANPKTGQNPTPGYGGISVAVTKLGDIVIRNCVVLNTASTGGGAIAAWGSERSNVVVENNLACNNTGYGFFLHSGFHPAEVERMPQFTFRNNTSVFGSKPDPGATHGGSGLRVDAPTRVTAEWNVFGLNDFYGVDNSRQAAEFALNDNLFVANLRADYLEFDTKMNVDELEDESDRLDEAEDNVASDELRPRVSKEWAAVYLSRAIVDRAAREAEVEAVQSGANELRSILGLPLEGTSVGEYSDAWLPRISLQDALACGSAKVLDQFGCEDPGESDPIP